ncbi:hypothetical protein JCM33374_g4110 [Metschnikowia sp. JCM 33374]|nr:hypothetical protein JCM33374_g4110 [Metschnikowia sp. JCM 33374]
MAISMEHTDDGVAAEVIDDDGAIAKTQSEVVAFTIESDVDGMAILESMDESIWIFFGDGERVSECEVHNVG